MGNASGASAGSVARKTSNQGVGAPRKKSSANGASAPGANGATTSKGSAPVVRLGATGVVVGAGGGNGKTTTAPSSSTLPQPALPQPALPQQQQQGRPSGSDTKTKHTSTAHGPTNSRLEALQTEKQVMKQIHDIETHNPRKTLVDKGELSMETGDGSRFTLTWSYVSQTGYYPENLSKANQDMVSVIAPLPAPTAPPHTPPMSFFGVYDGHGTHGDACSAFARDHVPVLMAQSDAFKRGDFERAFHDSYVQANAEMHMQERYGKFTDMLSGTTAVCALVVGRVLYVANVGDSRAIMAVRDEAGTLRAEPLSIDQTPFREDERERVKRAGARVLTMDQIEGYRDINDQNFGTEDDDDGDPPRLWSQEGAFPGTAFTRSLGDMVAERIGVYAEPELLRRELAPEDEFLLIASDGVFEFMSSQTVADIVAEYDDGVEACRGLVAEAYRLWLQYEVRTDDISVILVRFRGLTPPPLAASAVGGPRKLERTKSTIKDAVKAAGEVRPVRRNLSRVKMGAVGQMHIDPAEFENYALPVHAKSKEEATRIKSAVRANFLFRHLNEDQLDKAVAAMETIAVKAGDVIIRQFDEGDRFYIADFGEYDVEVAVPKTRPNPSDPDAPIPIEGEYEPPRRVFTYDSKHGNNPCFGELALMYSKPRAATVLARTDGRLWALERRAFRSILMKTPARRLIQLLRKVEVLKPLSRADLQRMADLMTEERFKDGAYIVRQGEPGDAFYIITEGKAIVTKTDVGGTNAVKVMDLTEYMYFGERALLHSSPRAANVIAVGPVRVLSISRKHFQDVLGHIEDRLDADRDLREKKSRRNLLAQDTTVTEERSAFAGSVKCVDDLNGGVFAGGAFQAGAATVRVCQHDGAYLTIKTIAKRALVARKEVALAMNELRVLRDITAKSSNVPTLAGTLSSPDVLQQVLSACVVSEFARFLGKPLPRDHVQYAVLCVANGLDFLQSLSILYRGVVPESIGVNHKGVLQLLDFRFSKALIDNDRTFTICGTPEYMSPEQIAGIGHGFEADWWSVGVFAYECLMGTTPWGGDGKNEISIYSAISSFSGSSLTFPPDADESAAAFIQAVLVPDADARLSTAAEVLGHVFLRRMDTSARERSPFEAQTKELFANAIASARVEASALDADAAWPGTELDQKAFDGW